MVALQYFLDLQWGLVGLTVIVVVTSVLSVSVHAGLAMAHDVLPYLLIFSWIVLGLAVRDHDSLLAAVAFVLVVYHLSLVVPRFRSNRLPRWTATAPGLGLIVSNVYIDNATPDVLAHELVAADADVLVILEWNPSFAAALQRCGADQSYPHRLVDDDDHGEYVVCIASRLPFATSGIVQIGPLKMAQVAVTVGDSTLQIVGLNPTAVVDPGGYRQWKAQLEALTGAIPSFERPVVLAGDFNTTRFRPQFRALLKAGLIDAHDALGKGLSASFKLAARGLWARPGTIVRLDHALLSKGVCAVDIHDLPSGGSDHRPFQMKLAVRQPRDRLHAPFTTPASVTDQTS